MDLLRTFSAHRNELYSAVLADTLDTLGHRTSALPPRIRPLSPTWKIFGRVATLSMAAVSEVPQHPYAVEMECIDNLGAGDVLVISTNGDQQIAVWGELLSTASRAHGAVGVVLDGLTRDAEKILAMDFPVFATGFTPLDSKGRLDGVSSGQPIQLGSCMVRPGDYLFGDLDGVVVIPAELGERTLTQALEKARGENLVRGELAAGKSVRETFAKLGIL
jgi:4-hydroxy-4-methyl-2-oxoglutarate aldolase